MRVSSDITKPENVSDADAFQSFTISQLFPSTIATMENGGAGIHSPYSTLVALLKGNAQLMPDELEISEGQVILIPSTYPCDVLPVGRSQIELAAIDFCFKSHGMDISTALPKHPIVIVDNPADLLSRDICTICNSDDVSSSISRTTEQLASGFRIANTLSLVLGWNTDPKLSPPEDSELQTLKTFLENNCHLPLTIDDIAAECNLSRRKAFKVASRHPDRTPMRILKQVRLERSLEHLRKEDSSIGRIATAVGFGDARNYAREFKKRFGLSPLQYRQQSQMNQHTRKLVDKAEVNMRTNISRRASELYLQAIDSAPPNTDLNELHYKAGQALVLAGEGAKAKEAWANVTTLYYRLLIDMEECEHTSKSTDCDRIIEKLKRVYDHGNRKLRFKVASKLSEWMLQCASTGKQRATKQYSIVAKELANEHHELRPNLARALYSTGQFEDIERCCPKQSIQISAALRETGRFHEHLERFPEMRLQNALIHLRMGNTETVLSDYEDQPEICVRALVYADRSEEALTRYPQCNAEALMALGRYEEILEQHPDDLEMCVYALANLGRESEALTKAMSSADLTSRLLLYLGRSHDITASPARDFTVQNVRAATILQGLHVLEKGDLRYGLEILDSVQSLADLDFRVGHDFYEGDLIIPLIRHLLPDVAKDLPQSRWPSLTVHLRKIVDRWRKCYAQRLWYDARFILGEIDESDYHSQPYRLHSELRLSLAKGITAELNDKQAEAATCYQRYLRKLSPLTANYNGGADPVIKAFIRWRLNVLA